jgi:hypothetical protein
MTWIQLAITAAATIICWECLLFVLFEGRVHLALSWKADAKKWKWATQHTRALLEAEVSGSRRMWESWKELKQENREIKQIFNSVFNANSNSKSN